MITERSPQTWHWQGHPVRLVDGASIALPDTPDNQEVYPQPSSQQAGLGFPLCRPVGMICLGRGAVLNAAIGPCRGKGSDEQPLLRSILATLAAGDILLGDAYYATYFLLCALQAQGVDGVFEQQGARRRSTDFRLCLVLGSWRFKSPVNRHRRRASVGIQNLCLEDLVSVECQRTTVLTNLSTHGQNGRPTGIPHGRVSDQQQGLAHRVLVGVATVRATAV